MNRARGTAESLVLVSASENVMFRKPGIPSERHCQGQRSLPREVRPNSERTSAQKLSQRGGIPQP
jgi:hypothetical protein